LAAYAALTGNALPNKRFVAHAAFRALRAFGATVPPPTFQNALDFCAATDLALRRQVDRDAERQGEPAARQAAGLLTFYGVAIMRRTVLLLWLFLLPSAAIADPSLLPGIWWSPEEGVQVTFRSDGTLSIAVKDAVQEGHWSAEGEDLTFRLKPPGGGAELSLTCRFRIAENRLVIRPGDPKCGESSFQRLS
jgi:hypothetical protein